MPFKKLHRVKKLTSLGGGRKKASLGKRVLSHVGRNKVAYGAGAGAYVVGKRSGKKHKKAAVLGAYGVGYERGRQGKPYRL